MTRREEYGLKFIKIKKWGDTYLFLESDGSSNSLSAPWALTLRYFNIYELENLIDEIEIAQTPGTQANVDFEDFHYADTVTDTNITIEPPNVIVLGQAYPMQAAKELIQEWIDFKKKKPWYRFFF